MRSDVIWVQYVRSYVIVLRSTHLEVSAKQEILGTPYMRHFLSMGMEVQHFQQLFPIFNGAKFKIKVDLKEKLTVRYSGEVYQGIYRCVEWRSITRTLEGIRCTTGFADMSGRKL